MDEALDVIGAQCGQIPCPKTGFVIWAVGLPFVKTVDAPAMIPPPQTSPYLATAGIIPPPNI